MKTLNKKFEELNRQCAMCEAEFQIWVDNLRSSDENKEKLNNKMLAYCPVCSRIDER